MLTTSTEPAGCQPPLCDETELALRVNLIFATLQTDMGLANSFRWEFPADQPEKLAAAKASWYRVELGRVPKLLFDLALRRLGAEYQAGRANKSLPSFGDFMALCRPKPEAVGLPTMDAAWAEAQRHATNSRHRWTHTAVLLALKATGPHEVRHATGPAVRELRALFDRYYQQLVLQVINGEELAAPRQMLGHDGMKSPDELAADQRLQAQGLAGAGLAAREQLLAQLKIKRRSV